MKKLQHIRTRRQLLRLTTVSAASIPFLALARSSASAAQNNNNQGNNNNRVGNNQGGNGGNTPRSCFLRGTKISTAAGDRLVQDLQIGDEVETSSGRRTIKWIGYNKFTKEKGAWQNSVMPNRVARCAIDDRTPHRDIYLSPLHWHLFQ
jgi:hypothetical protein